MMTRYQATEGSEDRYGEMTGAISINMFFSMVPVGLWSFFIGPSLCGFWPTLGIGLVMACVLPLAMFPLSRKIWSYLSAWAERF